MTHHPHLHMIVPGARDVRRRFTLDLLPPRLLPASACALEAVPSADAGELAAAHAAGKLAFFGEHGHLAGTQAAVVRAPLKKTKWFVYAKRPFAGFEALLAYLSGYTHRVAIANSRLIAADATGVIFKEGYRSEGRDRYKTMTLAPDEFIRRFLIHVVTAGFHRIRHYGLFANGARAETLARARELLAVLDPATKTRRVKRPSATGQRRSPILAPAAAAA